MTFPNESFDLVLSQDVLEHVFHPDKAFAEIARTLKQGGAHLFTVPLYSRKTTVIRAVEAEGIVAHLQPPDYHGNPIDEKGSLVVREWGEDIIDYIEQHSGMKTSIHKLLDRAIGIGGELFISRKW